MNIGPRHALSEIRKNYSSLRWWRNQVFIPYVIGSATQYHPHCPGYDKGVRVMDEDWDNLFLLDACRADAFEKMIDIDSFDKYRRETSLGSHSIEWTRRNFAGKKFGDTVYVSANPHTEIVASDCFHKLVELRKTDFDEEMKTVLPAQVVDTALDTHQRYPDKRLIVHFMQPHGPFVYEGATPSPFEGTKEEFWREYEKSLEYVVSHARELAEKLGGKTVITADHGQTHQKNICGLIKINPHPPRFRLPELVTVPWATIDNERREIRDGEVQPLEPSNDLEDRLRYLGYHQ